MSSAFVLVYALAVLPSGYLSDRVSRRLIVGVGVGVWSLATLLTGLTRSFPQILLARAGLGIGESTSLPAGSPSSVITSPRQTAAVPLASWSRPFRLELESG